MGNLDAHLAESRMGVQQTNQQAKVTHTHGARNNNNVGIQQQHMVHENSRNKTIVEKPLTSHHGILPSIVKRDFHKSKQTMHLQP